MIDWINKKINERFVVSSDDGKHAILIEAHPLSPFRGLGTISISISENDRNTKIICDILPYNNACPYVILVGLGLMSLWTIAGLLISWSQNTFSMLAMGGADAVVTTFISLRSNKRKLRDYARDIVKELIR